MRHHTLLLIFWVLSLGIIQAVPLLNGADQIDKIVSLLKSKRVGLVVNHTSLVGDKQTHLLDTLLSRGVHVVSVFAPEHGFRGNADAGEVVMNGRDKQSGLPIISLYGKNKKPAREQLSGIDVIVFDIQDVGARFYTYISTMYYVMQSCAETGVEMVVLDRPNPNDYIDGPIMQDSLRSFVGMLPLPVLHGLTIGELAGMIRGENWGDTHSLKLTVIPVKGWQHGDSYILPVKPSPNLPNSRSITLYPSLCFFEATDISVGRGTRYPFQVLGYPDKKFGTFSFTPRALPGFDKNPLQKDKTCFGIDLREIEVSGGLSLKYILDFYRIADQGKSFFTRPRFFDMLMGNTQVRMDIIAGKNESQIKGRWADELKEYRQMRKRYLLYLDFRNFD